jgi:hypothetical protein
MTTEHRYPLAALLPDYGRGLVGAALSGGAWSLAPAAPAAIVIFGGLTGLFLVFTIRNVWRHRMRVSLGGDGLALGGMRRETVAWRDLSGLRLRYYATRRNRQGGWMTLQLKAGTTKVALDSSLTGFSEIVARAAEAARRNDLALDDVTLANLAAVARGETAGPAEGALR